jgi:hypothetical protein
LSEQPPPPPGSPPPGAPPPGGAPPGSPGAWSAPEFRLPAPPPDDVTGYVRQNARRYTREAVTARLAAAGHSPEEVAAAWATVDAEDATEGRRDRRGAVSALIGGAYVLTWLGVTAAWLVSEPGQATSVALVSGLLAAFLFLPGLIGFVLARRSRRLQRARMGTAVAFALVPLLILVALAGSCLAIVPPSGFA